MPLADNNTITSEANKQDRISEHIDKSNDSSNQLDDNAGGSNNVRPGEKIDEARIKNFNGDTAPICFPSDLSGDFYISFNAFKFSQDRFKEAKRNFSFEKSIYLPLPQSITDSFGASYTPENLMFVGNAVREDLKNVATADGTTSFNNLFSGGAANRAASRISDYIQSLSSDEGVRQAAAAFGVAALSNPNMGVLGAAAKTSFQVTTNPYPVMIYTGTGFKSFSFEWTFYPESDEETETVKKIIGYFRREMLPEQDVNNPSILKTPAIWEVKLKPDSHMKRFKKCVVTGLDVNYTPNGVAFIYMRTSEADPKRVPAGITMRVNFQEIEIWLANDFSELEFDKFDYIDSIKPVEASQSLTSLARQAERNTEPEARKAAGTPFGDPRPGG